MVKPAVHTYENDPQSIWKFHSHMRDFDVVRKSNGYQGAINRFSTYDFEQEALTTLKPRSPDEFNTCAKLLALALSNDPVPPTITKTKKERPNFIESCEKFFSIENINFWRVRIALDILRDKGLVSDVIVIKEPICIKYKGKNPRKNGAPIEINLEINTDPKSHYLSTDRIHSFKLNPSGYSLTELAEALTGTLAAPPYHDRNIFDTVIENSFRQESYIKNSNADFKKQLRKLLYNLSQDLLKTKIEDPIIYQEWFRTLLKDELDTKALEKIQKYFKQDPKNIFLNPNSFFLQRMKIAALKYNSETKDSDCISIRDFVSSNNPKINSWLKSKAIIGKIIRTSQDFKLDLFLLSTQKSYPGKEKAKNRKKIFYIGESSISAIAKSLTELTAIPKNTLSQKTKEYLKRQYMFSIESMLQEEPYISKPLLKTDIESAKKFFEPLIDYALANFKTGTQFQLLHKWIKLISSNKVPQDIDQIFTKLQHTPNINLLNVLRNFPNTGEARTNFLLSLLEGRKEIKGFRASAPKSYLDILGIDTQIVLNQDGEMLLPLQIKSDKTEARIFRNKRPKSGNPVPIEVINGKNDLSEILKQISAAIKIPSKFISEYDFRRFTNPIHIPHSSIKSRFANIIREILVNRARSRSFEEREELLAQLESSQ